MTSEIKVDTISEQTSANGVAIDSLGIKDGKITNLMNATLSAADLGSGIHIKTADSGASANAAADELVIEQGSSGNGAGLSILSATDDTCNIFFGDSGDNDVAFIQYNHSSNEMVFTVNTAETLRLGNSMDISTGGETAPDVSDGGICLDQGSDDTAIMTFKSSDISHGFTGQVEADTYGRIQKHSANGGGLQILGLADDDPGLILFGVADAGSGTVASNTNAYIQVDARKTSSGSVGGIGSEMLCAFQNDGACKVIFTGAGNIHADTSTGSGTVGVFDEYEDAHLVRAYDLYQSDYAAGLIDSKFDKFISYNAEKLADLDLIGRDDDGTPNGFVNVTGFQKLHNGAIWQQYEKHQRLASAFYKLAEKTIGKEEADKLLTEEEIQLLN